MKHIVKIILPILLLGTFLTSSMLVCDTERKSIKVSLSTSTKRPSANRDLSPDVKVYYYPEEDLLELTCYETKETTVYIMTTSGEELSIDTFSSDMTPYYSIEAPDTPGTYLIVIDSPVIYGEGYFIVK